MGKNGGLPKCHRPQFAYSTPPGCRDEEFTYTFDGSNTPMLYADISGRAISNIPFPLDRDAPFYWRGIKVALLSSAAGPNGTVGGITGYAFPEVYVKFRDCYENDLSDGLVAATQYAFPQNPVQPNNNSLLTGPPTPLDPEIYCPAGGVIFFFLRAPVLAGPSLLSVTLYGMKRYKECNS